MQIMQYRQHSSMEGGHQKDLQSMLSKVFVPRCQSLAQLEHILSHLDERIIECSVQLVIVDSIAAVTRMESSSSMPLPVRQRLLVRCSSALKHLAEKYRVAVLCSNQMSRGGGSVAEELRSIGDLHATLGTSWAHCVNTAMVIQVGLCGN